MRPKILFVKFRTTRSTESLHCCGQTVFNVSHSPLLQQHLSSQCRTATVRLHVVIAIHDFTTFQHENQRPMNSTGIRYPPKASHHPLTWISFVIRTIDGSFTRQRHDWTFAAGNTSKSVVTPAGHRISYSCTTTISARPPATSVFSRLH